VDGDDDDGGVILVSSSTVSGTVVDWSVSEPEFGTFSTEYHPYRTGQEIRLGVNVNFCRGDI
jgi:hypothetical protein